LSGPKSCSNPASAANGSGGGCQGAGDGNSWACDPTTQHCHCINARSACPSGSSGQVYDGCYYETCSHVSDGDFEFQTSFTNTSSPWYTEWTTNNQSASNTSPYSAIADLLMQESSGTDAKMSQIVSGLSTNTNYTLSAWMLAVMGTGDSFKLEVTDVNGNSITSNSPQKVTSSTGGVYVQKSIAFNTGSLTSVKVSIYSFNKSGSAHYRVDAVSLQ
jgi:hypothetical protein